MRKLVWAFGWVAVVVWSLVCAATYGLFDVVGRIFMRNADSFSSDPSTVEGIWKFFSVLHGFSTSAIMVGWAVVSLLILAVPWLLDRMVGKAVPRPGAPTAYGRMPYGPGVSPDGVIDLGPDQYSVGNPGQRGAPSGPVPRITPRP